MVRMTDEEMEGALYQGFLLAFRVIYHAHDIKVPAKDDRTFALLQEVADGETTVASSPADLTHRFPKADPTYIQRLWDAVPRIIANDRQIAQAILRARDRTRERLLRRDQDGPPPG